MKKFTPNINYMSEVSDTLKQRQNVHGEFLENSEITETIMDIYRRYDKFNNLPKFMKVSIYMITHKISRIISGDPHFKDHWHDVGGYAKCVEDRL